MPPPRFKNFFEMLFYQHPPFFVRAVKKKVAVVRLLFDYILSAHPACGRDWKGGLARCEAMEREGAEPCKARFLSCMRKQTGQKAARNIKNNL